MEELLERQLERLSENLGPQVLRAARASPHFPYLAKLLTFSPYAARLLTTRSEILAPFLRPEPLRILGARELSQEARLALSQARGLREAARGLLPLKQREILKILARDLAGESFELTARRVTRLAEALVSSALRTLARWKGLSPEDLVVLAFGKFGGRELNYASDLDLAYFFLPGVDKLRAIQVFETLTRLLDTLFEGDRLWKVDLRLRPGGKEGELAVSLRYARDYYLYASHPFERLALIRARPVAGNLAAGYALLAALRPVIYPRYLDFAFLEHLRDLKERIQREARRRGAEEDLKVGRGGIREVEFLVQGLQAIYGGKHPELRSRRVLAALARLRRRGILKEEEARRLREAYLFLRTVEHRLQTRHFQQTFRLPKEPLARLLLAQSLGFEDEKSFLEHLSRIREEVSRAFGAFLAPTCPRERSEVVELLVKAVYENGPLAQAAACAEIPEHLLDELRRKLSSRGPLLTRKAQILRRLLPLLFEAVLAEEDRGRALSRFLTFFDRLGGRLSLLSALEKAPEGLPRLLRLLSRSEYLWYLTEGEPRAVEALFEPEAPQKPEALASMLQGLPLDEALGTLRILKNETCFRTAAGCLEGLLTVEKATEELTRLAKVFARLTLEIVLREVREKHGPPPGPFAVLALGKLGAREMGFRSDLDLLFVYEGPPEAGYYWSRVAQRYLSYLTLKTPEGEGYPVDARLRPEGRKGPLVSSLSGLLTYYREEARLWERAAAVRLRPLAGDRDLGRRTNLAVRKELARKGLSEAEARELYEMRLYMERERAREDERSFSPKLGYGALADLEFLAMAAALRRLSQTPEFTETRTPKLLGLLPEGPALREHYAFLRAVEQYLILLFDPREEDPLYPREALSGLVPYLGPEVRERYEKITRENREFLRKYLLGDSGGVPA
ncbi:hypothetical protein FVE67_07640 [Thermosulfurimonas marina]|uniref:Uncharacterized protein n=1 Tax=Thermosulfurimonas marina TaxID=2047767 RepID=A0A6H1WU46_9BACT|nr:DUF294 nucleotidyltransferase-like domain-containing protein [Thermosulfurimonas marina]QJA06674.1 hypothetical protein FVE67_07640 [Thermosulfurimonas marina]